MIIIGVDLGLCTGWGIISVEGSRYRFIACGTIRPKETLPPEQKYLSILNGLLAQIEKHRPDALAVETQFVDKNVQSAIKLGMARGMAYIAAATHNIPVFDYAPMKVKQAVGGKSKESVMYMVKLLLNITLEERHDAFDALAIAIAHAHNRRMHVRLS